MFLSHISCQANISKAAICKLIKIAMLKTKDYQLMPETMKKELVVEFP